MGKKEPAKRAAPVAAPELASVDARAEIERLKAGLADVTAGRQRNIELRDRAESKTAEVVAQRDQAYYRIKELEAEVARLNKDAEGR